MKVLVVASDKGELKGLDDRFIKVVSGVGPILAAVAASKSIERERPDIVISLGSAGAINPALKLGCAYSFQKIVCPDQNLTAMHLALGTTLGRNRATIGEVETNERKSGLVLSSSGTFSTSLRREHSELRADAADMEAYGVALATMEERIPFYALKLITDYIGDGSTIGDISFNLRLARENLICLLEDVLQGL